MMLKILSILPGIVGTLCILILLGSLYGYSYEERINDIPIVPCSDDEEIGCRVGMTNADIEVPNAFSLLEIQIVVEWNEPDRSWFGVVHDYPKICEPDDNGLSNCTEQDFEGYIIAGGSSSTGLLKFEMEPENYRFITGGKQGSTLSDQDILLQIDVGLTSIIELSLGGIGLFLLLGATEMAFPFKEWFEKFRNA